MTKPIDLDRILELAKKLRSDPLSISAASNLKNACDPTTITALAEELKESREVINNLYQDIHMAYLIESFSRDTEPKGNSTGVVAMVHNIEHANRVKIAFLKAKEYKKKWGLE